MKYPVFEDVRGGGAVRRALALAGMKNISVQHNIRSERPAHVLSGANVNFHGLRYSSNAASWGTARKGYRRRPFRKKRGAQILPVAWRAYGRI